MVECEKDLKACIEVQAPSTPPTVHEITSQDEVWTSASPSHPCHSDQHNAVEQMHDPRPPDGIQLPSNDQAMNRSDWQILPRHFSNYNAAYGPYTLDACADKLGLNAMVSTYWTAKEDCCKMDWAGHNAWANPPFHLAGEVLQRFLTCKRSRPEDTAATFVLPVWKTASWWRLLEDNFRVVDYYPPYSSVFTGSPLKAGEARRAVGGVPWPVVVIQWPYGLLGAAKDMSSTKLFHELPDPSVTGKQLEGIQAIQVNAELTNDQRASVDELLQSHAHAFASDMQGLGRTSLTTHRIHTTDAPPVARRPYRYSKEENEFIDTMVQEQLQCGLIEKSFSPWAAPVVLSPEPGKPHPRMCQDYRGLNAATKTDSFPMPDVEEALASFGKAKYFTTLDLKSGIWQVPIHHDDREKTAFTTRKGLFQFNVMPFGLKNAPATFQRLIQEVLEGLSYVRCTSMTSSFSQRLLRSICCTLTQCFCG